MPDDPTKSGGAPARPQDGAPPSWPSWWPELTRDGWLLFATYSVRLGAYAFVSVVLGLYLAELGLETWAIGLVFTAALAGGGVMTGLLSFAADRFGRRRVLVLGA